MLPFVYDRLSLEAKAHVVQLSLLGFAKTTDFEISIAGWLGAPAGKDAAPTERAFASMTRTQRDLWHQQGVGLVGVVTVLATIWELAPG